MYIEMNTYDASDEDGHPTHAVPRLRGKGAAEGASEVRKKYIYSAFFLLLSLISFVIQTETAVYIQHELGWNKAYAML